MAGRCAVGVSVSTEDRATGSYTVHLRHYEPLRDMLDRGEKGWVELESVFGDGKVFLRLDLITDLCLCTPSFVEEKYEYDRAQDVEP